MMSIGAPKAIRTLTASRRLLSAGLCAACLFTAGRAGADDAKTAGDTLQFLGAFADLTGQGEVGDALTMAGILVGETSQDPGAQITAINSQIQQIQTDLKVISQNMTNLVDAQNLTAAAMAQGWNAGTLADLNEKMDLLQSSIYEVLIPLNGATASQIDAVPAGATTPRGNPFHLAAAGVAEATMKQVDDFLDLRYLPYGGGCMGGAGSTSEGLVGDCSPNPLWVISNVIPAKVPDRDASGLLRSYGLVDGVEVVPAYKFRPEVALGTYVAELRVAIAAMATDLGGEDMALAGAGGADGAKLAYFQSTYAHLFDRHIAFLTYREFPGDPGPDGLGDTDFHRYVTHTNTSLSDAYYVAMDFKEDGVSPTTWETIDRTRDMLTYARAHGNLEGWRYAKPGYVTLAETNPNAPKPPYGAGGAPIKISCAILGNCEVQSVTPTAMVGVTAAGDAYGININADQLSLTPQPLWHQPGIKYIMSNWGPNTYVSTQSQSIYAETRGQTAPRNLGLDVIYDMLSTTMFGGSDGVVYFIETDGDLYWMRDKGSGFGPPVRIGNGWGSMRAVVGAGQGVIYAVTATGDLLWYRHDGYLDGAVKWEGPGKLAKGWDKYYRIVANPYGVLVAGSAGGSADLYQYLDYDKGTSDMADPPAPHSPAARMKGPFPLSGVDLSQYPFLAGVLDPTPSGVVK